MSFKPDSDKQLKDNWVNYKIPLDELDRGADLTDLRGALYVWSDIPADNKRLDIKNIYYSAN